MRNAFILKLSIALLITASPAAALHLYDPGHDYTAEEIAELNWFELTLLASEPYARQGYVFDSDWLMDVYLATDWYGPVHGTREHIEAAMKFTPKEEADMARFKETAAGLGKTYENCWNVADLASLEYGYYRAVSSAAVPPLELPEAFAALGEGDGVSIWSRPAVDAGDLLGDEQAGDPDERKYFMAGGGDYYRVYFRDDGTIAAVEALTESGAGLFTLWQAWFDEGGALRLFHPVYKGGGWVSTIAIASFTGGGGDTRLRCLIHGNVVKIDMEVRGGPYAELPFTVNLYDGKQDDEGRYEKLIGN